MRNQAGQAALAGCCVAARGRRTWCSLCAFSVAVASLRACASLPSCAQTGVYGECSIRNVNIRIVQTHKRTRALPYRGRVESFSFCRAFLWGGRDGGSSGVLLKSARLGPASMEV